MTKKRIKLPGVTLIELLIVMAILPMMLILVSSMFGIFLESQERAVAQSSVNQEQQYILKKIAYDVGQASAILVPAADGATSSALQLQQGSAIVEYAPSASTLIRHLDGEFAPVTSGRVLLDTFTIQRLGNAEGKDSVRLSFSLSSTASASLGMISREITTTYTLR
jgi:Tfp pilus assembly protein PilE